MSIISLKNISVHYGKNVVLSDVNAEIYKGDIIAILGASGSGKSALLRAINFIEPPTSGEILFMGKPINEKKIDQTRLKIGMVFKDSRLFSHLSLMENISLGPVNYLKKSKQKANNDSLLLLKSVGLAEKANYYPHQIRERQRLRVALARSIAMNPEVLLIDDSAGLLEQIALDGILSYVENNTQKKQTILIETHDIDYIRSSTNRVFYLDEKSIYEEGSPDKLFNNPEREKTKDFINNLHSIRFEVHSRDFDFVDLHNNLENFCIRNHIELKSATKINLLVEELINNVIMPIYPSCSLKISYSKTVNRFMISVSYQAVEPINNMQKDDNVLESTENIISVKMIKKYATNINHTYLDNLNTINVEI